MLKRWKPPAEPAPEKGKKKCGCRKMPQYIGRKTLEELLLENYRTLKTK